MAKKKAEVIEENKAVEPKAQPSEVEAPKKESQDSELQNHPKFAKFKKGEN